MKILNHFRQFSSVFADYYDPRSFLSRGLPAYAKYQLGLVRNVKPSILNIELTNRCNLKCTMCNHADGFRRAMGDMDEATHRAAILKNSDIQAIVYNGVGEPMMHPQFYDFLGFTLSVRNRRRVGLSTNATLITEKSAPRLMDLGLGFIQFSMDGLDDVYEGIRGFSYEKFERKVYTAVEAKKQTNSKTRLYLSVTVVNEDIIPQIDEINRRYETMIDNITVRSLKSVGIDSRQIRTTRKCLEVYFSPMIYWNGSINACCPDHENTLDLGNCQETTVTQAYNCDNMIQLRKNILAGHFTPPCDKCTEIPHNMIVKLWS